MRWIFLGGGLLLLVVLAVVVVGSLLPKAHQASGEATVRAKPDAVFAILVDVPAAPTWRTGVKRAETLSPRDGKTVFKEWGDNGEVTYLVEESSPPTRLVTRVVDQTAFGGTWTYELWPDGEGTRIRITERGEVYN